MRDDELKHETAEVAAEDVYEAAMARAARVQAALILSEAQVLGWKRRYVEAVRAGEVDRAALAAMREADAAALWAARDAAQDEAIRLETQGDIKEARGARVISHMLRKRAEAAEGVNDGAEDDNRTAAGGAAGPAVAFPG